MTARGTYADGNLGEYVEGFAFMDFTASVGRPREAGEVQTNTFKAFCRAREDANQLLDKRGEVPVEDQTLADYVTGRAFR